MLIKVAATDRRWLASQDTFFVNRVRIPLLNELEEKSRARIILGKFVNKP